MLDAWPKRAGEPFVAVCGWLYAAPEAVTVDDMARRFKGARRDEVEEALEGLSALGLAVRWEVDGAPRWQTVQRAAG